MAEPPEPDADAVARPAYVVALFVAVTWAAVVFAADGLIAVFADRDPVPPGVSVYYGLLATGAAGVVVWIAAARAPLAPAPVLPALVGGAGVYLLLVASGALSSIHLVLVQATSPLTISAAVGAVLAVAGTWVGMRSWRSRDRRSPP